MTVERTSPIRSSDFDSKFGDEIMRHPGGENLNLCYQCGCCTATCPVSKLTDAFKPQYVLRMIMLGFRKEVLSGQSIWLCASCYLCQERCPQGVEVAQILLAARNIASREGYTPKAFVEQASTLVKKGRLAEGTTMTERQRDTLGLPKIATSPFEKVRTIFEKTSFDKLVDKLRGE